MEERFILGTEDGGISFDIFDCDGDATSVVCTTRELRYAEFIVAALNHCQIFWHVFDLYQARYSVEY